MSHPQKFFITTAIPYVNGDPHMGHALEFIQTDLIARYRRLRGDEVFFLTGADENSLKNVQAAEKEGIPTADLVERNTKKFIDLCAALEISNDDFIRTVSKKHFDGVKKLWDASNPADLFKKSYKGLYCVGCETYYKPEELVEGKCPEHLTEPDVIEEENYFFRLSDYQEKLEQLIESDTYKIVPEFRKNEVLSFIRGGLQDFSVSRSHERARGWGIPVPGDEGQVIYVWYDALGNYITGLDYADPGAGTDPANRYTQFWPCNVHCIGKGIIRFHAIYWPAMLMSAGLPLPKELFVHGYITFNGQKMGKALGNVIDPYAQIQEYGVEVLRYYMIRHISPVQDGDYNTAALEEAYTAHLANGIGNLLSRSLTMVVKNGGGVIEPVACDGEAEQAVIAKFAEVIAEFERLMDRYEFNTAYDKVWEGITLLDRYINEKAPWKMAKDPAQADALKAVLYTLSEGLRITASLLAPVMPRTAREIWRRLDLTQEIGSVPWETQKQWGMLTAGLQVEKGEPLFPRLEPKTEASE